MNLSKSFTAAGNGTALLFKHGATFYYSVSGTFVGTVVLQKSVDGGQTWETVTSKTAGATGTVLVVSPEKTSALYRWKCTAFTSGTIVTAITETSYNDFKKLLIPAPGLAKAGTTAGWVVAAGDDVSLVTCPASQTASTLVIPIVGLKQNQVIKGFWLVGQIESAGNTATLDASLRKHTAAAADVSDASVASMTQISATADAIVGPINSAVEGLSEVVDLDETYYLLITATTAASTDIALQGAVILVEE